MIQPVAFFIDDGQQLRALRTIRSLASEQAGHCRFHRCQRRPEIVSNRIQQCRFQSFALPFRLGLPQLLDGSGALDRNRHKTAHRVQRLPGHHCSGNSQAPDGTRTQTHWNKVQPGAGFDRYFIAQKRRLRLLLVHQRHAVARAVELVFLRKKQLRCACFKTVHDVIRNSVHQLNDVSLAQQFLAEVIKPLDLMPPPVCFVGLFANARRKLAANKRSHQERCQRHPVLWVRDRECPRWRQKEIIERQHRGHRHGSGDSHAPHCGNC